MSQSAERMNGTCFIDAVRALRQENPNLGVKAMVERLRADKYITNAKEVREMLAMIKAEDECQQCNLQFDFQCSGQPKPLSLSRMRYPLDEQHEHVGCGHPLLIVGRNPTTKTNGEQLEFQDALCSELEVSFAPEVQMMLVGEPSPEIMVVKGDTPDKVDIFWYARSGVDVYPICVTYWWVVSGVQVRDLPFVRATDAKAAFARLSETIDAVRDDVQEEKYRQLCDAAKEVFNIVA